MKTFGYENELERARDIGREREAAKLALAVLIFCAGLIAAWVLAGIVGCQP